MGFVEESAQMSIQKQCKLLGVPRSSYDHKPKCTVNKLDEMLMQTMDRIYMEEPTYTAVGGFATSCSNSITR